MTFAATLRELDAKATPGPWLRDPRYRDGTCDSNGITVYTSPEVKSPGVLAYKSEILSTPSGQDFRVTDEDTDEDSDEAEAAMVEIESNVALLTTLRNALPALAALAEAAGALTDRLDEMCVGPTTRVQVEAVRAALSALDAAVAK